MSSAPSSGPERRASRPPRTTSEPTRSQRPRTSSALRRSASAPPSVLELGNRREQCPPHRKPQRDWDEDARRGERDPHHHEDRHRTEQGSNPTERQPVRHGRANRTTRVELDERAGGRRHDEREPEQRQRRSHHDRHVGEQARQIARDAAEEVDSRKQEPLEDGGDDGDRDQEEPKTEEEPRLLHVHRGGRGEDLAPRAPTTDAPPGHRRPGCLDHDEGEQPEEAREDDERRGRVSEQRAQRTRAALDGGAEEVGRARPEQAPGRHGVAAIAPVLRPFDRRQPLRLHVGAGRPVEEGLLQLAPPSLERDPRERVGGGRGVTRDRQDVRHERAVRSPGVVAADPRLGRAAEVQGVGELVGVRAGGRIDDGVGAADDLELVVVPRRLLGALVRAIADLDRALVERIRRVVGVEDELDHLPVALVRVVEVVEGVEEPVLQRELPGRRSSPTPRARRSRGRSLA